MTATIKPQSFVWDTGDENTRAAQTTYTTPDPGSPSSPAVRHTYETKSSVGHPPDGVYLVSVTTTWKGSYSIDGGAPVELGEFKTTSTTPYQVVEIVSVPG